jgi:hypothetical protein
MTLAIALEQALLREAERKAAIPPRKKQLQTTVVTDEQVAELRRLKDQGWICRDARAVVMPHASESYAASIWAYARRV